MRRWAWVVGAVFAVAGAAGCDQVAAGLPGGTATPEPTVAPAGAAAPSAAEVKDATARLAKVGTVVPDKSGYRRTRDFGPAWSVDLDRNGCGTRDDILRRDLEKPQLRGRCVVIAGVLDDPYTGRTVLFRKADADEVQIDHVVPLAAAWGSGARQWPQQQRERFANDPLNLMATSKKANLSKGDDTPSQWLPRPEFRCAYAVRYVRVVSHYRLGIGAADRAVLARELGACPAGR